jgi:hypothetical protein
MSEQKQWTSWATVGGILLALVGLPTGVYLSRPDANPNTLEAQIETQRIQAEALTPRQRHEDFKKKLDELKALENDPNFATVSATKQEYVRGRIRELQAFDAFAQKVSQLAEPKTVGGDESLQALKIMLAAVAIPAEYQTEWSDAATHARYAAILEEFKALEAAVQNTRAGLEDLVQSGKRVLEQSAEPNLPRRAKEVLLRAKQLPDPTLDGEKLIPASKDIRFATVFGFASIRNLYERDWRPLRETLEKVADLGKP